MSFIAGVLMSGIIKSVWGLGAFFVPAPSPRNIKLALDLVKPSSIYEAPTNYGLDTVSILKEKVGANTCVIMCYL